MIHIIESQAANDHPVVWALRYFKTLDESNACMHTAEVRYSPITFRLAEFLSDLVSECAEVTAVLDHRGLYAEDLGR